MSAARAVRVALAPALALGLACTAFRARGAVPRIDSVRPDSVVMQGGAVVEVVVRGAGFAPGSPGRNTVRFGEVPLTDVPASEDGTELRFVVPDRMPVKGDAAPLPLESGDYRVRVETGVGTSNPVVVRIFR